MKSISFHGLPFFHLASVTPAEFGVYCCHCRNQVRGTQCAVCKRLTFQCAICHVAVRGSSNFCLSCGHGGHTSHMMEWFRSQEVCPTGCGCHCLLQSTFWWLPSATLLQVLIHCPDKRQLHPAPRVGFLWCISQCLSDGVFRVWHLKKCQSCPLLDGYCGTGRLHRVDNCVWCSLRIAYSGEVSFQNNPWKWLLQTQECCIHLKKKKKTFFFFRFSKSILSLRKRDTSFTCPV